MQSIDAVCRQSHGRSKLLQLSFLLFAVVAGIPACEAPLGPMERLPDSAIGFVPPSEYLDWWARTEACSGRSFPPGGIAWYVVPQASSFMITQGSVIANWSRGTDGSRIVIAGAFLDSEMVVRHEMLHALLDRGDHPSQYFVDRCHLTWSSWASQAGYSPPTHAPTDRSVLFSSSFLATSRESGRRPTGFDYSAG